MQLSDFLDAGITTAMGVLGTDTVTRSQVKCPFVGGSVSWTNISQFLLRINSTILLILTQFESFCNAEGMPHSLLLSLRGCGTMSCPLWQMKLVWARGHPLHGC